jgi:processive 1,2-diacylglycerol beta-glucosyltransferase
LLEREQPDVILSTYPIYNYLIDEIHRGVARRPFWQLTVITDSLTINSVWYRCSSDYFLVANEESADVLRKASIAENKIRVFGFPVTPLFASMPRERSRMESILKVLFMINSGKDTAPEVARRLSSRKDVQLTVTVGRDDALRAKIEQAVAEAPNPVEIHGWTKEIPRLLTSHHILISKAGGATVQESIAACTPMIITQVVPGQEEGNAQLIVENNCGALSTTTDAIVESIETALKNGGEIYQQWERNITRLSRPAASLEIARFAMDLPSRQPSAAAGDKSIDTGIE